MGLWFRGIELVEQRPRGRDARLRGLVLGTSNEDRSITPPYVEDGTGGVTHHVSHHHHMPFTRLASGHAATHHSAHHASTLGRLGGLRSSFRSVSVLRFCNTDGSRQHHSAGKQ